jgi:hypothetical protein
MTAASCLSRAAQVQADPSRDGRHGAPAVARLASNHRQGALTAPAGSGEMMKFYSLIAAAIVFFPVAYAVTNQAAMIVAA